MLFSTNPRDMSIERMMTSVAGFPPKGHGIYVFGRHKYTAEECDCRLCPHFKRKKCKLPKCGCIEERIEAVAVGYAEFMKHSLEPIKNKAFQVRFAKYINDESEMKFMLYRGDAHKEMFERAIERILNSDNAMLSALYLLTADKYLWSKVRFAIGNSAINFSAVRLGDVSTNAYTLYADPKITDEARCIHTRMDLGVVGTHRGERSGVLVVEGPRAILTPDKEKVRQQGRRMKDPDEPMFTITAQDRHGIWHKGRVRKLMPIECWRLQGYTDEQFNKVAALGIPDGQLYKMAGNSVSVPVISAIGQKIKAVNDRYNITGSEEK